MSRTQTIVQLTDRLVASLDAEAARRGISRSALIREALETFLEGQEDAAITRQIVDGYRRTPQAAPDEWGDLGAHADVATRELLERLHAEEGAAGLEPW